MNTIWLVMGIWLVAAGAIILFHRRDLVAVWREPFLRYPVMIIESDDWGAGPVESQAAALNQLVDVLTRYRDRNGRHPVMTLALVLAVPDGTAIRRDGQYHRRVLDDPLFEPVRQAIERGRAAGVFALQLHGLEHYWPDGLMSSKEPAVRAWLTSELPGTTEKLPSHLQSRWVDATELPSRPLEPSAIAAAVADEVQLFERVFGARPRVAVPPTFVWTADVEQAWANEGVEFVVTPGLRSACRDATGLPNCDTGPFFNGQRGSGVTYLVRDDYFEPERGHRAERAMLALATKTVQGRPCLFETHRSNFVGDSAVAADALNQIERCIAQSLSRYSGLRFLSTEELGRAILLKDPEWIERDWLPRVAKWGSRLPSIAGFWRLARLTGLAWFFRVSTFAITAGLGR